MCDYSMMALPNRLAVCGEESVVHRFNLGSVGMTSKSDLAQSRKAGFLAKLKRLLEYPSEECCVAVCVPPGAHLLLRDIPRPVQRTARIDCSVQEVVFTQVNLVGYRDAVRFPTGVELLLQKLRPGQRVRVLSLSSPEHEPEEAPQVEVLSR